MKINSLFATLGPTALEAVHSDLIKQFPKVIQLLPEIQLPMASNIQETPRGCRRHANDA
jgi:hypothetical protein